MQVVTVEEMRRIERAADQAGHSYAEMMARAGLAVAQVVQARVGDSRPNVLVLVGPGNNGGDGLVAGRYLHEGGCAVTLYLWKRDPTPDPNLERALALNIPVLRAETETAGLPRLRALAERCDVIVDALLGSGATGALRGGLREVLRVVHEVRGRGVLSSARAQSAPSSMRSLGPCARSIAGQVANPLVVAVDVPSGLNCDTGEADDLTPQADVTITFAYPKRGHFLYPGAGRVGELLVADIGTDPAVTDPALGAGIFLHVATPEVVAALLPARPADAHKGTFGKALVVAGCANYTGAPCLAAEAAYRSGAGLVTLAVAGRIHPIVAARLTEATYLVLPDDMGALNPDAWRVLADRVAGYSALLVGPGLGTEATTGEFVQALLGTKAATQRRSVGFAVSAKQPEPAPVALPPLVLDADALNLLAGRGEWWRALPAECVLTPHPGEMARLLGCDIATVQADRIETARQAAQRWGCTVVLKGAFTVVATRAGEATLIPFANPALATAGTGDVLAGTIVGLLAQGLGGYAAAVCGAYLHALAAELWSGEHGSSGMLASDLLPRLPLARRDLLSGGG